MQKLQAAWSFWGQKHRKNLQKIEKRDDKPMKKNKKQIDWAQ